MTYSHAVMIVRWCGAWPPAETWNCATTYERVFYR